MRESVRVVLYELHRSAVVSAVISEDEIAENSLQHLCLRLKSSQGECPPTVVVGADSITTPSEVIGQHGREIKLNKTDPSH